MAEFEGIVFEIKGNATEAATSLDRFAESLDKVQDKSQVFRNIASALREVKEAANGFQGANFQKFADGLKAFTAAADGMKGSMRTIGSVANALKKFSGVENIKIQSSVGDGIKSITEAVNNIPDGTFETIEKTANALQKLSTVGKINITKTTGDNIRNIADAVSKLPDSAFTAIEKLSSSLKHLSEIGDVKVSSSIGNQIRNIAQAVDEISDTTILKIFQLTSALSRLRGIDLRGFSNATKVAQKLQNQPTSGKTGVAESGVNEKDIQEASGKLRTLRTELDKLRKKVSLKVSTTSLDRVSKAIRDTANDLQSLGKKIVIKIESATVGRLKKQLESVKSIFRSLGRIAFYRLIRSAIKAVTKAFTEGLKNAYFFSEGLSNAIDGRIATALDNLATKALTMKNQLGAAFGSLLTALAPVINTLISLITALANALTQLFAAFTGGTFLRAKDTTAKFAEETKKGGAAAKEWKNQLMGFDEINKLNDQSGGGGGGGSSALDPNDMFEVADIDEAFKDFVDRLKTAVKNGDWQSVGKLIGDKINEAIANVKWIKIGNTIGYYLNAAIQSVYYTLKTVDFLELGKRVASTINNALARIDFKVWGRLLIRKFTAMLDFLLGLLGNLNWEMIGRKIGDFITGAFNEAAEWVKSYDWSAVFQNVIDNISAFFKGLTAGFKDIPAISAAFDLIRTAIERLKPAFQWLWNKVLSPLASWTGGKFADILDLITKRLQDFTSLIKGDMSFREWLNTLSPLERGLLAVAVAIGVVTTALTIYHTVQTAILATLNLARVAFLAFTSPVGLAVIAIAALVAIGIALYRNWDKISAWWQDSVVARFKEGGAELRADWERTKASVSAVPEKIKAAWSGAVESVGASLSALAQRIGEKLQAIPVAVESLGKKLVDAFTAPFKKAYDAIAKIVQQIKNLLNFQWSIPRPKIPVISWDWSYLKFANFSLPIPNFRINWYAKGGIFDKASLIGVGENGREAVVPLDRNKEWISKVAMELETQLSGSNTNGDAIASEIRGAIYDAMLAVMNNSEKNNKGNSVVLNVNGREFMRAVYDDYKAVASERGISLVTGR